MDTKLPQKVRVAVEQFTVLDGSVNEWRGGGGLWVGGGGEEGEGGSNNRQYNHYNQYNQHK